MRGSFPSWLGAAVVALFGAVWIGAALSIGAPFVLVAAGVLATGVGFGAVAWTARIRRRAARGRDE